MTHDRDDDSPNHLKPSEPDTQFEQSEKPTVEADFAPPEASVVAGETVLSSGVIPVDTAGETSGEQPTARREGKQTSGNAAMLVGTGILISRVIGLVRQRIFAYYFGISASRDAYEAAFRIPNFLQNVFGEGALSASFIPVYSNLLAQGDEREANRVAGAIFTLLALTTSVLVLAGVLIAPQLTSLIAYGFEGERRALTEQLVRIFFPGAGLLVLSAWCLGVLNSHRKFFLSYTAPIVWNFAIIATLLIFGRAAEQSTFAEQSRLAIYAAWGSVFGSLLQFVVQLPAVISVARTIRPAFDVASESVRKVMRNFFPVFISRGVVQISAFIDSQIASFLPLTAVSALATAQSLYTLPVSLFGMSISAAKLPAMSSAIGSTDEIAAQLRHELDEGLRHIAFNIVPSVVAFLALGDVITAALYQTGQFNRAATLYVWGILAGSTVGLLASTLGRLYSSTFYALSDTRTPLRYAVLRVTLATILGYFVALRLPALLGIDALWGVAGLTAASGVAGWVEFLLLRRTLNRRIGRTGLAFNFTSKLWLAALASATVALSIKYFTQTLHPIITAILVLAPYGLSYFAITYAMRLPEAQAIVGRGLRLIWRR